MPNIGRASLDRRPANVLLVTLNADVTNIIRASLHPSL
jgi:hypothetical protein